MVVVTARSERLDPVLGLVEFQVPAEGADTPSCDLTAAL